HVRALDPAQVVARVDPSGPQPLADPLGALEVPPDEAGHAHRQQLRRVRLDPKAAGQLQPPAEQPGQPVDGQPIVHAERRLEPGDEGVPRRPPGALRGVAPSRGDTPAPRSYQPTASSASPARSWWPATCAATASGSPACS